MTKRRATITFGLWVALAASGACTRATGPGPGAGGLGRGASALQDLPLTPCAFDDFEARLAQARTGPRRVALLVGVGRFAFPEAPPLEGPPQDVAAMQALLTEPAAGYGVARADVCALGDEAAGVVFRRHETQGCRQGGKNSGQHAGKPGSGIDG